VILHQYVNGKNHLYLSTVYMLMAQTSILLPPSINQNIERQVLTT